MTTKSPIRVLIVDDPAVVRVGLVSMLTLENDLHFVAEAETGEQAITLYQEHRPDVTLIDVRMPGMDGIEALRLIMETSPEACVLMLSTSELPEDVAQAVEAGASGYLLKRLGQEELVAASHLLLICRETVTNALKHAAPRRIAITFDFKDPRGQTLEDAEVGHRTSTLGHLGHIAIQLGRKLKFDPDKERFVGDDEANNMLALPPGRSPWTV